MPDIVLSEDYWLYEPMRPKDVMIDPDVLDALSCSGSVSTTEIDGF